MEECNELKKSNTNLKTALVVVTTLLMVIIIVLATLFGIYMADRDNLMGEVENIYQYAYYELLGNVLDIENSLDKFKVLTTPYLMEQTLENVIINAERASTALATMSSNANNTNTILRFINQIGDYSKFVLRKVERGETLGSEEYEILASLSKLIGGIGVSLNGMKDKIQDGYSFVKMLGTENDQFASLLKEIENGSVEYPSLIYDGPFSDGIKDKPAKGISGEDLTQESGKEKAKSYLVGYEINSIEFIGENNYRIDSYLYSAQLKGDRNATIQISKKGGSLLMLDIYKSISEPKLTIEDCVELAEQYCDNIGLKNMEAVWQSNNQSTVYINLCYNQNDTVYYPDMVKIKVSLDTGEIIGFEGLNYAYNHTERKLESPKLNAQQAMDKVSAQLTDKNCRLTLIPFTIEQEMLCYEISGKIGDNIYFIYVDVMSGDEVKILRVIDSNQGDLLM